MYREIEDNYISDSDFGYFLKWSAVLSLVFLLFISILIPLLSKVL